MEFKDLLKVLEEYYAKATEVQAVRQKWFNNELKTKNEKLLVENASRQAMTSAQDAVTSGLNYIFSYYSDHDSGDFEFVKRNIDRFVESANIWLECFEENKGE
jgi:uncharacterized protein YacL (UPF0231 family)